MTLLRRSISVLLILCLVHATTVAAATAQWSVNNLTYVFQIYNDGAGGCAFYATNIGGEYIGWYNNKGEKIYEKQITTGTMGLVSVDKKYLVFTIDSGTGLTLIQVDKKGAETPIAPAGVHFYPGMPSGIYQSILGDKKGYFVTEIVTATGEYRVRRYTYK
jgi:hypothetical protein